MKYIEPIVLFCLPVALAGVLGGQAFAQTRGPVVNRARTVPPTEEYLVEESAPVKAAKWPFRLGKQWFNRATQDQGSPGDPFLNQGADVQQQLAVKLTSGAGRPGNQMPANPFAPTQSATPSYPWPKPVDSQAATLGPDGTTWIDSPVRNDSNNGGSRIVDAIRKANAKMAKRLTASTSAAGGSKLTAPQKAMPADSSQFSDPIVNKYMRRLEAEGTATGEFVNQTTGGETNQQVAAARSFSSPPPHYATGTAIQVPLVEEAGGLPTPTQQIPTMNYYPRSDDTATTYHPPAYVVPHTQYVPLGPQHARPTIVDPQSATGNALAAGAPTFVAPRPPLPNPTSATPTTGLTGAATGAPASRSMPATTASPSVQSPLGSDQQTTTALATNAPVDRSSSFRPTGVEKVGVAAPNGEVAPAAEPSSESDTPSAVVSHVQRPPTAPAAPREMPAVGMSTPSVGLGTPDKHTRVLAHVGDQTILAGDVLSQVNQVLEPYKMQMTDEEYEQQSELLIRKMLPSLVENKLVSLDFLRTVPPDKVPELESKVFEYFREHKLPEMKEKLAAASTADLDAKLRDMGSSLAKQQRLFFEKFVGTEAVRRNVDIDAEITHDQLLEYYRDHEADFAYTARARWERLSVAVDRFHSHDEAYNALVAMGNQVKQGAPFAEVAKNGSQGPRASHGGQYDWTTKDSLRSKIIDQLIFSLPPGEMSRIVEDEGSLHIIRVTERVDAGVTSFSEAQAKISEKIKETRFKQGAERYLDRLRDETYVWTVYDEPQTETAARPAASDATKF